MKKSFVVLLIHAVLAGGLVMLIGPDTWVTCAAAVAVQVLIFSANLFGYFAGAYDPPF
jgi:hypothetical protein